MNPSIHDPGQQFMVKVIRESELQVLSNLRGDIQSVNPPETLFGYLYHSHMVPPLRPENALFLGYGMGTVPALIRKVYGQFKCTGVDEKKADWSYVENKMVIGDALEFVKECYNAFIKWRYDYVAVDLFDKNGYVPQFVFTPEFASMLSSITTKLLCLNVRAEDFEKLTPFSEYGFTFHRCDQVWNNNVSWWGR